MNAAQITHKENILLDIGKKGFKISSEKYNSVEKEISDETYLKINTLITRDLQNQIENP